MSSRISYRISSFFEKRIVILQNYRDFIRLYIICEIADDDRKRHLRIACTYCSTELLEISHEHRKLCILTS